MGMETAKKVFETRKKAADFFGLSESENLPANPHHPNNTQPGAAPRSVR